MKSILFGIAGSIGLLFLYAAVMILFTGSWSAAVDQFLALWYFIVPIAAGFGIQVGLYVKLTEKMRHAAKGTLSVSGTSAAAGMLACCVHHIADVLPILGFSAVSMVLARYQIPILAVSLVINLYGIVVMMRRLQLIQRSVI